MPSAARNDADGLNAGRTLREAPSVSELAPAFLVAVPQLGDPNFSRAIVLMLEHSPKGAIGLVVNRPSPLTLFEVARSQGVPSRDEQRAAPVFSGGPVETERGFLLHADPLLPESVELVDQLFVSSSIEALKQLLAGPPVGWRLCLGYAGWGPGQLEEELKEGAWLVAPPAARHVLETPPKKAWDAVLHDLGIDPSMLLHTSGLH